MEFSPRFGDARLPSRSDSIWIPNLNHLSCRGLKLFDQIQLKFPDISEEYLFWCKGYVQETLPNVRFDLETTKLWIFDLDLYDATLFALTNVLDFIQIGDICYFDEAFDVGEFKIINDVLLTDFCCDYIGTNGQGLALLVKGKRNA